MFSLTLTKYIPILQTIREYKTEYVKKDLIAALTVAVVAIPQSMAYALIAGVNPVYGLYTAIVSAIIGSAFGSSKYLVTGPTNAISLLIAASMRNYMGLDNAYQILFLMTFVVGALQIFFGVIKLGKVINFVSHTVIVGFTAGAGVLIALEQLNTILSISIKNSAQMSTMGNLYYIITHIGQTNFYALGLGLMTIAIILICKRINKNIPGALIGIIVPIIFILIFALDKKGVALTGAIPSSLPPFKMVQFSIHSLQAVFSGAMAIAVIGLVEALSISKSISSTSQQKINANQEFIGQGISNALSAFFQCLPSSGSFTRSAINYHNGAVSRFSGILSGVIVALVLVFLSPFAKYIPSPCLAGVILVTAYSMIDKKEIRKVSKVGKFKSESIAMWVTCIATVIMPNLDYAIYTGIALSIVLYLRDTNKAPVRILIPSQGVKSQIIETEIDVVKGKVDILIIELEGNLYFGSSGDLENKLDNLVDKARVFVLRMMYVVTIDVTSLNVLRIFIKSVRDSGGILVISGVKSDLSIMLKNSSDSDISIESELMLSGNENLAYPFSDLEKAVLNNEAAVITQKNRWRVIC
ncbi:MAG TPA: SulP family inorganic anion transporter [Desulfosporosinus sp.]